MNFIEASKMPEGTIFNVMIENDGGGWLGCFFKDGIVHREIGDKLAASTKVFSADWKLADDEWSLSNHTVGYRSGNHEDRTFTYPDVKKCKELILKDIFKLGKVFTDEISEDIAPVIEKRFGEMK